MKNRCGNLVKDRHIKLDGWRVVRLVKESIGSDGFDSKVALSRLKIKSAAIDVRFSAQLDTKAGRFEAILPRQSLIIWYYRNTTNSE